MYVVLEYVRSFYSELSLASLRSLNIMSPRHIGFICDGNRTYAKSKQVTVERAYALGVQILVECTYWCKLIGVKEVTFYLLASKNLSRNEEGVKKIFDALENYLYIILMKNEDKCNDVSGCKYRVVGDLLLLPEKLRKLCQQLPTIDKNTEEMIVNLAVGHSGKTEIVNACARLARRVRARELSMNNLTEDLFHQQFYDERAPSDLNLIIRSSGHNRLSDFVTMQATRSFIDISAVQWPEFRMYNFLKAILHYELFRKRFSNHRTVSQIKYASMILSFIVFFFYYFIILCACFF